MSDYSLVFSCIITNFFKNLCNPHLHSEIFDLLQNCTSFCINFCDMYSSYYFIPHIGNRSQKKTFATCRLSVFTRKCDSVVFILFNVCEYTKICKICKHFLANDSRYTVKQSRFRPTGFPFRLVIFHGTL